MNRENIMQHFSNNHWPEYQQSVAEPFRALAEQVHFHVEYSVERTACLRKLLEAQFAAIRASVDVTESPTAEDGRDEIMQFFHRTGYLPEYIQTIAKPFADLAEQVHASINPGRERSVCLRKLLEAQEAAMRAKAADAHGTTADDIG